MYSAKEKSEEQQCVLSKRIAYTYIYPHIDLYTFNTPLAHSLTQNICMIHMLLLFLLLTLGHAHTHTLMFVCSETPIHYTKTESNEYEKVSAKKKRKNARTQAHTHAMMTMTMTTTTMELSKTISKCLATNNLCWENTFGKVKRMRFDFC